MNQTGTLKGPFPKMMLGGRYLRRVDSQQGAYPQQADMRGSASQGVSGQRPITQPPYRFDGNQFQFDFRNGLLR
jgi:hypothetical protein